MTGLQMLLKSMGLNADEIMQQIEVARTELPIFARNLAAKVEAIESHMAAIEAKQEQILQLLTPPAGSDTFIAELDGEVNGNGSHT